MVCVIFNLSMAKLYVIFCLYTINCRNELREEWDSEQGTVDLDLDDIRFKVRSFPVSYSADGQVATICKFLHNQFTHLVFPACLW